MARVKDRSGIRSFFLCVFLFLFLFFSKISVYFVSIKIDDEKWLHLVQTIPSIWHATKCWKGVQLQSNLGKFFSENRGIHQPFYRTGAYQFHGARQTILARAASSLPTRWGGNNPDHEACLASIDKCFNRSRWKKMAWVSITYRLRMRKVKVAFSEIGKSGRFFSMRSTKGGIHSHLTS